MDGQHKKKRPRQRNRPKNKANRLLEAELNQSENLKSDPAQQQDIADKTISDANMKVTVPTTVPAENEACILLIQQLLRAKLLKQNASKGTAVVDKAKTKASVSDHLVSALQKSNSDDSTTDLSKYNVISAIDQTKTRPACTDSNVKKSKTKEMLDDQKVDKVASDHDLTKIPNNDLSSPKANLNKKDAKNSCKASSQKNETNHSKSSVEKSTSKEKLGDSKSKDTVETNTDQTKPKPTNSSKLNGQKSKSTKTLKNSLGDSVALNADHTKAPTDRTEINLKNSKSKENLVKSNLNNISANENSPNNQIDRSQLSVKKSKSKEKPANTQCAPTDRTNNETTDKDSILKKSKSKEKLLDQKLAKNILISDPSKSGIDHSESSVKKSISKEKIADIQVDQEKDAFIFNLTKKMESMMANNNDSELPQTLIDNLQKLFTQEPISDVESSDDEEEYIEYIYKPRQYFLVSLCNFCKCDLRAKELVQCSRCKMTYYCSADHMKCDDSHRQLCYALRQVADSTGNHLFYKCGEFTTEQFRSYRIVTIRKVEATINRSLTATEQEVILFPRICADTKCREYRFNKLTDCVNCGQVAYCKSNPEHLSKQHQFWCKPYQLFKELIIFQEKFGHLDPSLPTKILKDLPGVCCNTKQIFNKLTLDLQDQCEYAALSQISTCPLTAWYALKLCDQLKTDDVMTIHLIGAEIEFEVDVLHKWELFFLHITPSLKMLNVVFIGPELKPGKISFDQFKKTKCCRSCRKNERSVNYFFENKLYHNYCQMDTFLKPDLICFFNAGLYRSTGFQLEDTWPETILAASNLKVPIVVTAYTEYETPLDMTRIVQESNRRLNVVLPPIINPFASEKPERNFISDEDAPLMFKNYYCFVVE